MAAKQGGGKKKRTHKTSKGVHGAGGRVRTLTLLDLTLMGKGPLKDRRYGQERPVR